MLPGEYTGEQVWVTCDFDNGYPEHIKEKVLEQWDSYRLDSAG
jgi:hypothetical protein